MTLKIRPFALEDQEQVIALWRDCNLVVPQNDPQRDIALKLQFQPELFLVGELESRIVASVMAGYEGHRGWLNYLAVSPDFRHQGLGRALVEAAIEKLDALGCPKINLQIRSSNVGIIEFYRRLGFGVDDVVSMGRRL